MARRPTLAISEFDDLIEAEIIEEAVHEATADDENEYGITIDEAHLELVGLVEDAIQFVESELFPVWERADDFMDGDTDVPLEKGRSRAVQTVVRDGVRALRPNMMRVFTQTTAICRYAPANVQNPVASFIAEAQTSYNNQLFWESGGYLALYNTVYNALVKKIGVLKSYFQEEMHADYIELRQITQGQIEAIEQMPEVTIVEVEPEDEEGVTGLFRLEVAWLRTQGSVKIEDVPLSEFFFDDAATSPDDATVIGQRRVVTVGYARSIGLDYHNWKELGDEDDPEKNTGAGSRQKRAGYAKNMELSGRDLANFRFLLTEAYAKFDLDGTGHPQLYRFWLGGGSFAYLDHERVSEHPYSVAQSDPIPGAFAGSSIPEILDEDQNTQTSLLRATLDNAHLANNRRLAINDTMVNMGDVMSKVLGSPIRVRSPGQIQEIATESTLGASLPLLEFLKTRANDKVGVTNASMGLDPSALQSTDKEAVRNTIQLAQGQVELMCRNIAETGIAPAFRKLLTLSIRHKPSGQEAFVGGQSVPIDQVLFNPNLHLKAAVGTGTGDIQMQLTALQQIAAKQEQLMGQFGLDNPICGLTQAMNTIMDMGALMGMQNMGRYFNPVSQEIAQQLQQQLAEAAAAAKEEPPSAAIALAEQIRAQGALARQQAEAEHEREMANDRIMSETVKLLMDDDFKRDELAQRLQIEQAKILKIPVDQAEVERQQNMDRNYEAQQALLQLAARKSQEASQQQAAQAPMRSQVPQMPQPGAQQAQPPQQGMPPAGEGMPPAGGMPPQGMM